MIVILFRLNVGKLIFMGIDISDEQKNWRYMDLTKFIHLLTHEYIYFHKVSEFQDKYEGSLTPRDLEKCSPSLAEMTATQREWFFVSCWHINDSESNAMWQIYGKHSECIAIQTDFKTLKECFSETYNDEVEFSKVKYINYENTRMLDDIFSKGSMRVHDVIDYKHISYDYERELRAKVWLGHMPTKNRYFAVKDSNKGLYTEIDIRKLIKRVYLSPKASSMFVASIVRLMEKFQIEVEMHTSDL